MKQRLAGLLALVLCMLVLLAPVNGAMAYVRLEVSGNDAQVYISDGDLVPGESKFYRTSTCDLHFYVDGTLKTKVSRPTSDNAPPVPAPEDVETDYWYCFCEHGSGSAFFESTGRELKIDGQPEDIMVFNKVLPIPIDYGSSYIPAQTIMDAFNKAANGKALIPYEVMLVQPKKDENNDDVQGVYTTYNDKVTFYLPKPAGTDIQVLHYVQGDVKSETFTVEGNKLKIEADSLSPFAVVYTPYPVPGASASTPPQTGDESRLMLWFALAGLSAAGLAVLTAKRRKRT